MCTIWQGKNYQFNRKQRKKKRFKKDLRSSPHIAKLRIWQKKRLFIIKPILPSLGINRIAEITKPTIDSYILYLKEETEVNDITVNTSLRAVRAIIYYWQSLGYCPTFKIMLIIADKKMKETYSDSELRLLLEKPDMKKGGGDFSEYRNCKGKTW